MDQATARAQLESMVAASSEPTLTEAELDQLVRSAMRVDPVGNPPGNVATASVWVASTTYAYGDVVTADPAVGRWWRCVVPGMSSATQPAWPALTGLVCGATVYDGSVHWADVGGPWAPTWDLEAAAAKGWELKAGKAAEDFPFTTDAQTFERHKVMDHCERMAQNYRRRTVGSAPITSC